MKFLYLSISILFLISCAGVKEKGLNSNIVGTYDVSCGICNFEMTGEDCELAIEIDNKKYYIEGTAIDEHGDAHAEDGFCSTVRKAAVKGTLKHGVFLCESFELLPN